MTGKLKEYLGDDAPPMGPISVNYFREELMRWREVQGSTRFTLEQKDNAFRAIALQAFNLDPNDPDLEKAEGWWATHAMEWTRRRAYEEARPPPA